MIATMRSIAIFNLKFITMKALFVSSLLIFPALTSFGQTIELLPYGDFNNWVTRNIKESRIIGGRDKVCYEIAPTRTINGDEPYSNEGGSPWGCSNVMAKVCGITKVSNSVYPEERSAGNKCAKLVTKMDDVKALGIVSLDVLVTGSMYLGQINEPIKNTSDPYSKMDMGIPFTKRPKALILDYKLLMPDGYMVYSSGFGKKKTLDTKDKAEVVIILQRRWEDADGNIYAKRVGSGLEFFEKTTNGWQNAHQVPVIYGDASKQPGFKPELKLVTGDAGYQAKNSKGKMTPIQEVGWDDANATPTHMIVMISAGCGKAYTGVEGATFWVDNVGLVY